MGYCVTVDADNFSFKHSKKKEIMRSIKNAIRNKEIIEERWVDFDKVLKQSTLEGVLDELRFELSFDNETETYKIEFWGEKFGGYEESLFKTIAPYVNNGYIEYIGEDGEKWRYIFKDGVCKEIYPKLVWE